jgi:ectoine hydroxylase-related dioxygenase (phytanoyl-CoA dioxygenase family)
MDGQSLPIDPDQFDEAGYLRLYPDVAEAIARGDEVSGWNHYLNFGFSEGRQPNDFDEAFYLAAYPMAQLEIRQGHARSPLQHFLLLGRGRGYLPKPTAARAKNPAGHASPFGGLWIDLPHVNDLIAGKLETGLISEKQARQLRFFIENGYLILPDAVPEHAVAAARADLDRAYAGELPALHFESASLGRGPMPWGPAVLDHPAKVLDLHHISSACVSIMFSRKITEFLGLIFESKSFASQSLGFLRGSAQEGHQDSAYVVYSLPRHFAASWIALEDVTPGAGELFYYPGSHRFPEFIYGGAYKSIAEARRMGTPEDILDVELRAHVASLENNARRLGLSKSLFAARAGDALIWHADLVHGGSPVSDKATRKSLVTHYCPRYAAPHFSEHTRTKLFEHDGHFYTTGYYR